MTLNFQNLKKKKKRKKHEQLSEKESMWFFSMLSPPKKKPIRFENKSVKTYLAKEKPAKMAPPCQFPPAGEGAGKDGTTMVFLPSFLSQPSSAPLWPP